MLQLEMLSKDSYYVWKQKIKLFLAYREADDAVLKDNTFYRDSSEFLKWKQTNKMARAIIELSFS